MLDVDIVKKVGDKYDEIKKKNDADRQEKQEKQDAKFHIERMPKDRVKLYDPEWEMTKTKQTRSASNLRPATHIQNMNFVQQ